MDEPKNGEASPEKFYMVTRERPGKRGMFTSRPHATADEAKQEARRLAEKHPGVTFFVFGLIAMVRRKRRD